MIAFVVNGFFFVRVQLNGRKYGHKSRQFKRKINGTRSNFIKINNNYSSKEMIKSVSDELNFHKKEVQILKSEKDTLESVLSMKT